MLRGLNAGATVTYDGTSLIIDGKRRLLISGSIHYPRSTPEMWPGIIDKAKEGGLDCIQTYVFWNMHEPEQGKVRADGNFPIFLYNLGNIFIRICRMSFEICAVSKSVKCFLKFLSPMF